MDYPQAMKQNYKKVPMNDSMTNFQNLNEHVIVKPN